MRLLADENIPAGMVGALRAAAHDVGWIREDARGISDQEVLGLASSQDRVLITADKDFGELAFRGTRVTGGIVLIRARGTVEARTAALLAALGSRSDWSDLFAVVENDRVRITQLPATD